ncbi:MAG: molybdopterin-dependent oxidoreductase, partial [Dehalococcoidia bacterium]
MAEVKAESASVGEDRWIPSSCCMCYGMCSILGHVKDGVLVKIEGNPESPIGSGRLCPKGTSAIMTLYDPHRVNVPLKRTNPEKGRGVDPKWVEITWDEALDTIAERLKKILAEEPRKLFFQSTTTTSFSIRVGTHCFNTAFGTDNIWAAGGGLHCGNGAHEFNGMMHASWSLVPDYQYCNYTIYFGASKGHSAGHAANSCAQQAADARARGMKMVVVDPMCNFASNKATEWIPIRVGTDAALALAMINVLLNELGIYDAHYIKHHTNGPYLIKPDGHYLRQGEGGKPMVWDAGEGRAKAFDDATIGDFAIEGTFDIDGISCQPAFQLLREHVKSYTPEEASKITTIPAATISRIATEFGEAAKVGSTIVIEGKELPYRPVAAIFFRGAQGHRNSTYNCLAVDLLNHLMGAADVVGGALGFNPTSYGHPETGRPRYVPRPCPDGLMITGAWVVPHLPYPPHEPSPPRNLNLREIFPMGMLGSFLASREGEELWQRFGIDYRPEVLLNQGANSMMSVGNPDQVEEALKKIPFIVSFDLFLNEFTDFADMVLPDKMYLERLDFAPNYPFIFNHPAGMGEWGWAIRQPIVESHPNRRHFVEVMLELADRIG